MAALGLGYLPTGKRSRPGSQRLSVMIQIRNWKPPWQACVLAKFLPIWLSLICGQESWLLFWLISLQRHGICSYTARSRVLYRSGCDWCTTTLSRLSQTPSYFPRAWGHSLNTCQQSSAFGPECVKTLSHLVCPSPLRLGVVISRAFATISAGGASERL